MIRLLGVAVLLCRSGLSFVSAQDASPTPAPTATSAATDPDEFNYEQLLHDADALLAKWLEQRKSDPKAPPPDGLESAALHYFEGEKAKCIDDIATGGDIGDRQIPLPVDAATISLNLIQKLGAHRSNDPDGTISKWVLRRITENRIEVWLPDHGWLFSGKGELINEAHPHRRDGTGREWYGAFLPDGRWITTDLFENDKTLTFFSKAGKWLKEIKAVALLPPDGNDSRNNLIGWARSDKEGKGWVVSVGSEGGRGCVWIGPQGPARGLAPGDPWKLCHPRQLGAKGFYITREVPSDDQSRWLSTFTPGHGNGSQFTTFELARKRGEPKSNDSEAPFIRCYEGGSPMFWPASNRPFIDGKTWFLGESMKFERAIKANWIGDATDGKSMILLAENGTVLTIAPDYTLSGARRFEAPGGKLATPMPYGFYDDLSLGIFTVGGDLVIARWGIPREAK